MLGFVLVLSCAEGRGGDVVRAWVSSSAGDQHIASTPGCFSFVLKTKGWLLAFLQLFLWTLLGMKGLTACPGKLVLIPGPQVFLARRRGPCILPHTLKELGGTASSLQEISDFLSSML